MACNNFAGGAAKDFRYHYHRSCTVGLTNIPVPRKICKKTLNGQTSNYTLTVSLGNGACCMMLCVEEHIKPNEERKKAITLHVPFISFALLKFVQSKSYYITRINSIMYFVAHYTASTTME